jgi:hypothetical protein
MCSFVSLGSIRKIGLTARTRVDAGGEGASNKTLSRTYLAVVGAAVLGLDGVAATLPSPGAFSAAKPF